MKQLAVCGECLRVGVFASYREAELAPCACGAVVPEGDVGPYCPCEACERMAADLLAGGRTWKEVPMLSEGVVLAGWTPHQGELKLATVECAHCLEYDIEVPLPGGPRPARAPKLRDGEECPYARICEQEGECTSGCTMRLGVSA